MSSQLGGELDNLTALQEQMQTRLRQIDRTVRNLLDNITKSNRRLVDQRLTELGKERDQIDARLESFRRMILSEQESRELVNQTAKFIAGLKQSLTEEALDGRQAAIRRCIESIKIDHENSQAIIGIRKLPLIVGGSQVLDVEHVIVDVG